MENLKEGSGLTDDTTMYIDRKAYLKNKWWKQEGKRIFESWLLERKIREKEVGRK